MVHTYFFCIIDDFFQKIEVTYWDFLKHSNKRLRIRSSLIRHSTKNRKIFSSDDLVKKVIYLATSNAAKKWTMPIQNWRLAMNWFTIHFDDRLKDHL